MVVETQSVYFFGQVVYLCFQGSHKITFQLQIISIRVHFRVWLERMKNMVETISHIDKLWLSF